MSQLCAPAQRPQPQPQPLANNGEVSACGKEVEQLADRMRARARNIRLPNRTLRVHPVCVCVCVCFRANELSYVYILIPTRTSYLVFVHAKQKYYIIVYTVGETIERSSMEPVVTNFELYILWLNLTNIGHTHVAVSIKSTLYAPRGGVLPRTHRRQMVDHARW